MDKTFSQTAQRKPYRMDLAEHLSDCEFNYFRFTRVFPHYDQVENLKIAMPLAHSIDVDTNSSERILHFSVKERARYTTLVEICEVADESSSDWVNVHMQVRVYHDAQLAEVIAWHRDRYFKPHYDYPNQRMYLPDEKKQMNRLLGEWLEHCMRFGRLAEPVSMPSACMVSGKASGTTEA